MSVPGRCHFDSDGWLQGPVSITHVMTPNRYNSGFGTGRGVVLHTEAGYEAGTVATFMNPAAQVSAFFSIAQSGACHQYLPVGHGYCAWSQEAGNEAWRGVEDEDGTHPSVPLTAAQVATFAQILEACSAYDGFPLQVTDDPVNGHGLILHSDGGVAWGDHLSCPGPVRAAQRPAIIALAMSIRSGGTVAPSPAPSPREWVTAGMSSLASLASQEHTDPATILHLTAAHSAYPANISAYVNGVFAGTISSSAPMPEGLALWLP
jgi:hypothetical protein